jgi:DNA modification methylase
MDNLSESLKQIHELLKKADDLFDEDRYRGREDCDVPEMQIDYYIESAFIHTLVLLDKLNLSRTYEKVCDVFDKAREKGFRTSQQGVDEPYLQWSAEIYGFLQAIGNSYNIHPFSNLVSKDITSILRATLYSITDKNIFDKPPARESEVHSRIEAVLKCVFPDLKHKPSINKPIKNFQPDTGLPSVRTLIEYKFISDQNDAVSFPVK